MPGTPPPGLRVGVGAGGLEAPQPLLPSLPLPLPGFFLPGRGRGVWLSTFLSGPARPAGGRACGLGTWVGLSPGTRGPEAHWQTFRWEPLPSQGS